MKIFFIILALLTSTITPAYAAKDCDIINVKVNGLVCDFCAQALEKIFGKRDDVTGIKVNLDNGNVTINMKPGKTISDEVLTELITDSGYNITDIKKGC